MKKLLFIVIVFAALVFGGITYVTNRIEDEVTSDDLPETVYAGETSSQQGIQNTALTLFDPTDDSDEYTLIETFMNYVIYDSIKENLNEDYDPLGDCEETACETIIETNQLDIKYAYARLNDDDQIILTVSAHRDSYPSFNTAVHLTFDVSFNKLEGSLVLTLNQTHLGDDEISEAMLDRILSFVDKDTIEDSVTTGTLDLDEKTYSYTFTD